MAFPTGWGRKVALTVDSTYVSGTGSHTDFPIVITLDNIPTEAVDAGSNSALNGGGDIRFSSDSAGTTQLPCDIVQFVTNATAGNRKCEIHVKVPTLSTSTDTTIYMWYKKAGETQPAVTDPYGRNAVWSDYEFVLHLDDTSPTDSAGNYSPSVTSITSTRTGPYYGECLDFTGGRVIVDNTSTKLNSYPFLMQAQIYPDAAATGNHHILGNDKNQRGTAFWYDNIGAFSGNTQIISASRAIGIGGARPETATNSILAGNPYLVHFSGEETFAEVYINGAFMVDDSSDITPLVPTSGRWTVGDNDDFVVPFDGGIKEARLRNSIPNASWLSTEYNNASSASLFVTAGTPESVGGGGPAIQNVSPTGLSSAETFGTASITTGSVDISPTGIASIETFGTSALSTFYNISTTGMASEEAFGTALISPGEVFVLPNGIGTAEAFGSATVVNGGVVLQPTGISSEEFFGTAALTAQAYINAVGIASREVFGTASVDDGTQFIVAVGIDSGEVFGTLLVEGGAEITYTRIEEWLESLGAVSYTEGLYVFLVNKGYTGSTADMLYEYLKTKSAKLSHAERRQDWEDQGFN